MTERATREEVGRRIEALILKRNLTHEALAELIGVDVGTIGRWTRGEVDIRSKNVAKLASALEVEAHDLMAPAVEAGLSDQSQRPQRELRTIAFVAWLADTAQRDFAEIYQAVADRANQLESRPTASRYSKSHARARVSRQQLVDAVADYYDLPANGCDLYTAEVAGKPITLSIATKPEWIGLGIDLRADRETASLGSLIPPVTPPTTPLDDAAVKAGVARLADAEVHDKVLVNNPMYRLLDMNVGPDGLHPTFGLAYFADYALRNGLMEVELVDAITQAGTTDANGASSTPVRDALLPSAAAALDLSTYFCTGGPVGLVAIARPARNDKPADYVLLVQVRGNQVMDIPGKLSTIPKGWHQPLSEASSEAKLSTTLLREFEEELLGREDLEQMSEESRRAVDPLHQERHAEPMRPLLGTPDHLRLTCNGFGINLLSGTFEVPCLITIDDEHWWDQWGHLIAGNWETMSVNTYSSMDTHGLAALIHDPRWSNEGLFALIEGLRHLASHDQTGRVAPPKIALD